MTEGGEGKQKGKDVEEDEVLSLCKDKRVHFGKLFKSRSKGIF